MFLPLNPLSPPAMQSQRANPYPKKTASLWLLFLIHFDAFRASPWAYLTASWWRLRRKRVRSRSQFARLLGHSPRAYNWWMLWKEGVAEGDDGQYAGAPILALVDVRGQKGELNETLRNLSAEGISVFPIGTPDLPTLAEAALQIDWSRNPWLMPMLAGDRIAQGTAMAYREAVAETQAQIIYADDDLLNKLGRRYSPHFKPDWNSELFRYFDYLSASCILRSSKEELERLAHEPNWVQRLTNNRIGAGVPVHVRKVLHHRRSRFRPHLPVAASSSSAELPPITVVIPTRNRVDLLRTCLSGLAITEYPDMEVIVVDNDSDDPKTIDFLASLEGPGYSVLRHEGVFNYSAINNRAVQFSQGRLICLLNNDIEVIETNWLSTMAVQALRDDVGAVGARLLYPNGRIQHAGVVIGVGNAAGHAHRLLKPNEEGYFHRHSLPQYTSAVTAACLVVMRQRFEAVGGFDETNFTVAFNDVDLCMRLNQKGWQSLYEPRATLIHHESVSRGFDRDPVGAARLAREIAALKRLWDTDKVVDPFHHPTLSRASERFVIGL